jgi:hypothetical protein
VSTYAAVVLFLAPVGLGVALNSFLGRTELADRPPGRVAAFFGAGEARDAFDYAFQRRHSGGWVIVELVGHSPAEPRLIGGLYGGRSAIGQTPSLHDVYLQAAYTVTEDASGVRSLVERLDPERGTYVAASQIARIDFILESPPDQASTLVA